MNRLEARPSRGGAWLAARPIACPPAAAPTSRPGSGRDGRSPHDDAQAPLDAVAWDGVPLAVSTGRLRSGGRRGFPLPPRSRWARDLALAAAAAMVATGAIAGLSGSFTRLAPGTEPAAPPVQLATVLAPRVPAAPEIVAEARAQAVAPAPPATPPSPPPAPRPARDVVVSALLGGGGPETTASFVTPPARPRDLGAAAETAKGRGARLEESGPAVPPLRGASARPAGAFRQAVTRLVQFDTAPFPYDGMLPGTQEPFLNTEQGEERGHRTSRGRVLLEQETFADNRVLTHIPPGFDVDRPGILVVFFHGHGAVLKRDVLQRQQVPQQITASGANAVLVVPQFAVDASDSSAGRFWEEGGFARFLDESAQRLAQLQGDPASADKFRRMPVVVVAYSGGFVPAAYALNVGGAKDRVKGVVLLDAIYGEHEKFASWAASSRGNFLVNASTNYTKAQSTALERMLAARDVPVGTELKGNLSRGGAVFLSTGGEFNHRDYVTQAWTAKPIADVLSRLPDYRRGGGGNDAVASLDGGSRKQRSAAAAQ